MKISERAKPLKDKFGIGGIICSAFLICAFLICLFADFTAPYPYELQNMDLGASPPSFAHPLGTDIMGRDMLSRLIYGGRISFFVGILATAVSILIGVFYGMVSGLAGRKTDSVLMRIVDIIYSLPFTIFVILLTLAFGRSIWLIFVAIGAVEWLTMARIARAMTLDLKTSQFVEASKAMGQSAFGIIAKHILPNLMPSIIVCAALTMPSVMLLEAFLSFLGLGVQAPLPSLGSLIKDGAEYMEDAPWLLVFPAAFFSALLYCINLIGERLTLKNK
ncbi:MAG: ABC transporter permease [Opitutales bacterium]|nr:ABC transporter permease [Opitutales bacterium]